MTRRFTNTFGAIGFVAALASIGAFSHRAPAGSVGASELIDGSFQAQYEEGFKTANPLKEIAIAAVGSVKYAIFGEASNGAFVGADGWLFTTEEFAASDGFEMNILRSADKVAQISRQLAEQGIQLLPVVVPDKAEVYGDQLGVLRPAGVEQRHAAFIAALIARGLTVLDAEPVLTQAKPVGDVFLRDDTHWSPLGSRAVAQEIALHLADTPLARSSVTTETLAATSFDGDLLAYVPTGALRPFIGPAQSMIDQFETTVEPQTDLFAEVGIDVVLVGTSFSAKPEWHFEGFLKQALQADLLNFAQEGQGPFAPMAAFLVSETFKNTPPKIVIWEIPARYISKDYEL